MRALVYCAFCILYLSSEALIAIQQETKDSRNVPLDTKRISQIYSKFKATAEALNPNWRSPHVNEKTPVYKVEIESSSGFPTITLSGDVFLMLELDQLNVRSFAISDLDGYLKKPESGKPTAPGFTLSEALEVAKNLVKKLEGELPPDAILEECQINKVGIREWTATWSRDFKGFKEDYDPDFDWRDKITVSFDLQGGFTGFTKNWRPLVPKSYDVKIKRDAAIDASIKAVPALQATSIYKTFRPGGLKIRGLLSCQLSVCFPNWWLDPKRAFIVPKEPHRERRLCWVVRLETGVGIHEKALDSAVVKLTFYVDAATGEIVGAGIL